jgi:transposase
MAQRWRRDRAKELFWRRTLRAWQRSGQSVRAFCAERGLAESAFHFWRRELKRRNQEVQAGTPKRRRPTPVFVPLRAVADADAGTAAIGARGGIEVVLATGRRLCVGADFDAATLLRLLAVLEGRPC